MSSQRPGPSSAPDWRGGQGAFDERLDGVPASLAKDGSLELVAVDRKGARGGGCRRATHVGEGDRLAGRHDGGRVGRGLEGERARTEGEQPVSQGDVQEAVGLGEREGAGGVAPGALHGGHREVGGAGGALGVAPERNRRRAGRTVARSGARAAHHGRVARVNLGRCVALRRAGVAAPGDAADHAPAGNDGSGKKESSDRHQPASVHRLVGQAPHQRQTGSTRHSQRESVAEYTHPGLPTTVALSGQSPSSMQRSAAVWQ